MRRQRRNIDEDAVPASGGTAIGDPALYNQTILKLQDKSRKQIDRLSALAVYAEQMRFHLNSLSVVLSSGNKKDRQMSARLRKLIEEYDAWKAAPRTTRDGLDI